MPDIKFFQRTSAQTKFRAPELEKVYRLTLILSEINRGELRDYLALRGGTAINICFNSIPRLSIDIDLVLVRDGDKNRMQADKEHLRKRLPEIAVASGYEVEPYLNDYALDTFNLKYQNAFGVRDSIKVEVNYIAGRVPINPLQTNKLFDLFEISPQPIQTLSIDEVYGSKVETLIKRHAARDLFDVYQLAKTGLVQAASLRARMLFSCCIEIPTDFRSALNSNPADAITQKQIDNELRPYLHRGTEFNLEEARSTVGNFCQTLFTLETNQIRFLNDFLDKGIYSPDLLLPGKDQLKDHPGIKWRLQQMKRNAS
jgi:predicted nucleotidyltransferase component of viral defense system